MVQHDTVIAQLDGKIENETKLHQEVLHAPNICIVRMSVYVL